MQINICHISRWAVWLFTTNGEKLCLEKSIHVLGLTPLTNKEQDVIIP